MKDLPRAGRREKDSMSMVQLRSTACKGLEALQSNPQMRGMLPGLEGLLRHIIATGEAAKSVSQNGDGTFLIRTVGLSLIGIQEVFVRNVPKKLLDSIGAILSDLVLEGLSGAKEKLEPGRRVLAQRFAIGYELVDRTHESMGSCPIYVALETLMGNEMAFKVKAVELVVLGTAGWKKDKGVRKKDKGVRACALCGKSEVDCELKSCGNCKIVKYCSRDCQVGHWKGHKAFCKAVGEC